jgi:hypothetical protein
MDAIHRRLTSGWIGERAVTSYIANAIDHLGAVKSGAESGFELFRIFEDDLMLAGLPDTIRMRIIHALQMYPPLPTCSTSRPVMNIAQNGNSRIAIHFWLGHQVHLATRQSSSPRKALAVFLFCADLRSGAATICMHP